MFVCCYVLGVVFDSGFLVFGRCLRDIVIVWGGLRLYL